MNLPFNEHVYAELRRARMLHPQNQTSFHEGLAVLWEEFEEVKAEVFKKHPDHENLFRELVQVGAMAQRMAEDLDL